jgi:membrane associated rhomboid family serine protease
MNEPLSGYETVFRTRDRGECLESRLVLESVGIPAEVVFRDGWWSLVVNGGDTVVSAAELDAYRRENLDRSTRSATFSIYGGAAAGAFVYVGIIILIGLLTSRWALGPKWIPIGQMQAGRVMAGEWWRTVTALTLHLDVGHIAGNLVFGAVFGFLAGQAFGGGVAWLAIVIAGALGNFMNAMVQESSHTSMGASTAVFAALGVIVSHSLPPRASVQEKPLKRWSPLIGGILLFAFIGVHGENTDVVAHITGFLAGLLIGWLGFGLPSQWLGSQRVQQCAGAATIAIVAAAWIVGLVVTR